MSIKQVRMFNESVSQLSRSAAEMSKAVQNNTQEIKKIVKAIEESEQEQIKDWRKLDPLTESTRYPLAEGTPPAVNLDGKALLLKKLDIL